MVIGWRSSNTLQLATSAKSGLSGVHCRWWVCERYDGWGVRRGEMGNGEGQGVEGRGRGGGRREWDGGTRGGKERKEGEGKEGGGGLSKAERSNRR